MGQEKKLHPHQIEAIEAVLKGLDTPPGGIPAAGLRATVVAACGTGKTMIAAHCALELARGGRVLVLVPTLDLLTQTIAAWRDAGHFGPAVAVCSLDDDPELWAAGVRTTTSAPQLALWHGSGPVTMYATYASLPVLAAAFEGVYGLRLDPVDLAVVDEAHRTSGSLGKAWAAIHDNTEVPALRRLYLTATPRIWQERPASWEVQEGVRDALPEELAASMDDEKIFGPVVFELGLADAIAQGLLARYQILVVELVDPEVTPGRLHGEEGRDEEVRGLRLGALQAAVLRTAAEHGLQTTIAFHHRTVEAEAFCKGLPAVAGQLHADDPEKYPKKIWAGWLHGEHEAEHRRRVLGEFATTAHRAVLSNCKVLGEGVDIRAVDSVAILDPKGSAVDIVQAIGRALRQEPGQGKLASLIVPVFLNPGEQPEDMLISASYKPLVKVLRGLRAHDERVVELLAIPQENTPRKPAVSIGPEPEEGEEESRMLLRFSAPRDPVTVAQWVRFQVIDTERLDWMRGYALARSFHQEHGHLRVPLGWVDAKSGFPLGNWIRRQRAAATAGTLNGKRARELDALEMVWDPADADWQDNLAALHAYAQANGTLAAPRGAVALGRPVGQLLSNLRRPGALDGHPQRAAALEDIDPDWNPTWPIDWQRHYAAVRECLAGGAELGEILPGVTVRGEDIGRWLAKQRQHAVWHALVDGQRTRLEQLGITPLAPEQEAPAKPSGAASGTFERGVAALAQYKARTGCVGPISRSHVEVLPDGTEVKLGVFLSNTKSRRAKLTADKLQQLAGLGLEWAAAEGAA